MVATAAALGTETDVAAAGAPRAYRATSSTATGPHEGDDGEREGPAAGAGAAPRRDYPKGYNGVWRWA